MADKKGISSYTSASIETLRFPDDVRNSPGVYIGSVDAAGVWVAVREPLDNAIDEHIAGRGTSVHLHIADDGSYWVSDDAGGIPQGIKKHIAHINGKDVEVKTPTMQSIFGELHTSGKYHSEAYKVSRGTHGIGVKGTNAMSEFFEVFTLYKGKWYTIGFKKGKIVTKVSECKPPKLWDGKTPKKGTHIHFKPDASIFTAKTFPSSMAVEWAELAAYLTPGFKVTISSAKGSRDFFSDKGPTEYVSRMMEKAKCDGERTMFQYKSELADVIVAFTNADGCTVKGFVNGLSQSQGGKHVDSVTGALYAGLKPFIKTKKVTVDGKKKDVPAFKESDLKEGLMGLVNLYLHKATYSSQDKAKLTDDRAGAPLEALLEAATTEFFQKNKALAQRLADRATKMNELKSKFVMSKKAATRLNAMRRGGLPAKFASWDTRTKVSDRELFIVEGDSAGGTVKKARFPYQGVLPLKGKIMNALKDMKGKALESDEIISILAAIGYDANAADPYAKLNVGKIICLADPDPDGPFIGSTEIKVKSATNSYPTIQELAEGTALGIGKTFQVPVWHNGKEVWADATARLERNVDSLVALEIGGTKYKVSEDHKFACVYTRALRGRQMIEYKGHPGVVFVKAKDLRIGDRVYCPSNSMSVSGAHKRDLSIVDKETGLGYQPVSKMRVQTLAEPVPVYCLTVPRYHEFVLPSGIVSANCHINSLLLTLFYKYLPELFERGMVYVMAAPEFYAKFKKDGKSFIKIGDRLSVVQEKLKAANAPANTDIRHVKGYGELPAPLMRLMCMDPATRRLIRIKAIETEDRTDFIRLMNDDVEYRRDMLGLPKDAAEATDETEAPKRAVKKIAAANDKVEKRRDAIEAERIEAKKPPAKKTAVNKAKTLKKAA